jgi:replication initiation and membrane attachment protein DnaB
MNLQEKDDILVRLYYSIDIFKNKEHVVNILFDELTNNDQKIKKNNIAKIIKNWIRKNFEEDFKEVSKKHELKKKKKENTQLKKKKNKKKKTN